MTVSCFETSLPKSSINVDTNSRKMHCVNPLTSVGTLPFVMQ